eukprot:SAG11_NODE_1753_length_4310_cov_14.228707_2_plen_110_part_00
MAASSAPAAGYPVPFFEGAEKKVEIRFAVPADNARGMRALPVSTWATALGRGGVEIISSMSSSGWDSYVLSESSLFVSAPLRAAAPQARHSSAFAPLLGRLAQRRRRRR